MTNNIEEILTHHLTAFGNNNLDEIVKDYTEKSVLLTPKGLIKGLDQIRAFFKEYFTLIPTNSKFYMKQNLIAGNVAYIVWNSSSDVAEIPLGTDTMIFDGDKIEFHTVADYRCIK